MRIDSIHTQRLTIRPYTEDELLPRHRLMRETLNPTVTTAQTKRWLQWHLLSNEWHNEFDQPPYGDYAIVYEGVPIGSVGLVPSLIPWTVFEGGGPLLLTPECGLFFAMLPGHQGQGLATEAANAFSKHLFLQMGLNRMVATTTFDNSAAQRVMEKLGMRLRHNPQGSPAWFQVVGLLDHPLQRGK